MISCTPVIINWRSSVVPIDQPSFRLWGRMIQPTLSCLSSLAKGTISISVFALAYFGEVTLIIGLACLKCLGHFPSLWMTLRSKHSFGISLGQETLPQLSWDFKATPPLYPLSAKNGRLISCLVQQEKHRTMYTSVFMQTVLKESCSNIDG